jgi:uncharacterized protein
VTAAILIVPGWQNSGPEHWQSQWECDDPAFTRVDQHDWDTPKRADWVANLDRAVEDASAPVVFVAHSLGCIAVAAWAETASEHARRKCRGAFLVAPADVDREDAVEELRAWRPVPQSRLPFSSVVVASHTDEYVTFPRARAFADAWGSTLLDAGDAGHLNTTAGYGPWPSGRRLLTEFMDGLT